MSTSIKNYTFTVFVYLYMYLCVIVGWFSATTYEYTHV